MVFVTVGIRWAIGIWCAAALGLVAGSLGSGAGPTSIGLLLVVTAAPVVVLAALTRFRPAARTSTQVLYDKNDTPDARP